ncbi:13773_t:CDS:1 [Cetraspora pellucida]|uniref:13773_t:CDS:1 n=1 Tax=Cetraspora pellucida TaxID=1433469 RepID=A0A9N9B1H0_9GLOM|nr:13773_t:CDS:1 [Cetraspora pellucida]
MTQREVIKRQEIETTSLTGTTSFPTSREAITTRANLTALNAIQTNIVPIPVAVNSAPPVIITPYVTVTVPVFTDRIITTTPSVSNTPDSSSPQAIILAASVLSSVGIITILGIIVLCWFRRGEKRKFERDEVSQIHDDEVILRRSRRDNFDGSVDQSDDFVTYRPRDPDDEQLPSYAEAVVRGRASLQGQY